MSFAFFNFINYVYIYIYTYTHNYRCKHTRVCVCDCCPCLLVQYWAVFITYLSIYLSIYIYIYVCMYGCMYACTKWHPCGLKQISCAYAYYAFEVGRWCAEHLEQLHVCVCVFEVSFLGCPTSSPKFRILPPHTKKAVVPNPEPESAAKARHVMVGACRAILDLGI